MLLEESVCTPDPTLVCGSTAVPSDYCVHRMVCLQICRIGTVPQDSRVDRCAHIPDDN